MAKRAAPKKDLVRSPMTRGIRDLHFYDNSYHVYIVRHLLGYVIILIDTVSSTRTTKLFIPLR